MTARSDLAALIGSRICHDLISPIGAIGNGVELLMLDGGPKSPEIALISASVAAANARIRFFRVAFGAAMQDQRIRRSDVTGIVGDLMQGGRVAVDWSSVLDLSRNEVRLVFLAMMCCETALPFGGKIAVTQEAEGWTIAGSGARLRLDDALWAVLTDPRAVREITPAEVHFAVLAGETLRAGRPPAVAVTPGEVRITL